QTGQGILKSELHPRDLDIADVSVQQYARKRMNEQILLDGMARASASALEKLGLRMDESERDKLGEPAGILLNVTQQKQVAYPMFRSFGVSVHHRGCRGDAEAMRRPNDFDPLAHFQLVGA